MADGIWPQKKNKQHAPQRTKKMGIMADIICTSSSHIIGIQKIERP